MPRRNKKPRRVCRITIIRRTRLSMKLKPPQHKTAIVFILVLITGFSSVKSVSQVRQVGAPASDLPSENLTADARILNNHFSTMGRESPEAADVSVGCPEANPATSGQAINVFSPPSTRVAWWRPRVVFENLTTSVPSVNSVAQWLATIIRVRRQPNPQVANNSGTHNEFLLLTRRPGGYSRPPKN